MDIFDITLVSSAYSPNVSWGSMLHGLLIELLPEPYPALLHEEGQRQLSQWLSVTGPNAFIWHICVTDDGLSEAIADVFQNKKTLQCKHLQCEFEVTDHVRKHTSMSDFMKEIYLAPEASRGVSIVFHTVTTHKSFGRYATFPSAELIAQSIRDRFCLLVPDFPLRDDEVMQQILENVYISRYKLQSATYGLEGHYVTGYIGRLEIHFKGPDPLRRLAETLFRFGNWSGIGIKTALGMGGCAVENLPQKEKMS